MGIEGFGFELDPNDPNLPDGIKTALTALQELAMRQADEAWEKRNAAGWDEDTIFQAVGSIFLMASAAEGAGLEGAQSAALAGLSVLGIKPSHLYELHERLIAEVREAEAAKQEAEAAKPDPEELERVAREQEEARHLLAQVFGEPDEST